MAQKEAEIILFGLESGDDLRIEYPELGDVIMFQNGYWEIDTISTAQFFVGKDPEYPYLDGAGQNPYEEDLGEFGYSVSVICKAHYTPSDKIKIQS